MIRHCLHIIVWISLAQPLAAQNEMARPMTFWYWMYGAVSKEGIHADLEGMKDIGLAGCYLMPIRGVDDRPEYGGTARQLSPTYWDMIDYAFQQADSLGLDIGIHISDGFALAGGPWISDEESMRHVVWDDTIITTEALAKEADITLSAARFTDIACFAFPVRYDEISERPRVTLSEGFTLDGRGTIRSDTAGYIQYSYSKEVTARNITIVTAGTNIQGERLSVTASSDGEHFHEVKRLTQPRQGWQSYLFDHINFSLPTTTARFFRFTWTPEGTEPGSEELDGAKWKANLKVKDIILSAEPRLGQYLIKSGALWGIAEEETDIARDDYYPTGDIIRLNMENTRVSVTPLLSLSRKRGIEKWHILRMGHCSTGMTNATGGDAKGLECDKFSPAAVNKQIDRWFGRHKERPHGDVVRYMHVDSWECGSQNWGCRFAEEFLSRRGYDLIPLLPVMAGVPIGSREESEKVLGDIRQTINDLINDKFFLTVARRAKEYGVLLSSESVAPTMVSDGMEHYKYVDLPMGEFWMNSPTHDKPNDMLDAIHGAYNYGRNIVEAEALTELRGVWDETPSMVKPLIDLNFALGANRLFFHVDAHNPWTDRRPGMTLDGIGLFFQRDNTWYKEAKGLVDYVTRCQRLLQEGKPVFDLAFWVGDAMPRRALTIDKVMKRAPSLFRRDLLEKEREREANIGQPTEQSPVMVTHARNILKADDYINPLDGRKYYTSEKDTVTGDIPPADILLPRGIDYIHRRGRRDIYFLTNQTGGEISFDASFRISGKKAQLYDAVTDGCLLPDTLIESDGSTQMPLHLDVGGSVFVIFDDTTATESRTPPRSHTSPPSFSPWRVTFRQTGETITTDTLFDWSGSGEDKIRYYSGRAVYETTFRGKVSSLTLDVRDIATVYVNGVNCGTLWTSPYTVDISRAVKRGKNRLLIEVVNTWANALLGSDLGAPPFDGIWTNATYRRRDKSTLPAGLLKIY